MEIEELEKEQKKRRKWVEETKKEYEIIYQNFLEEFEKMSNLDVFRPPILLAHLYAGFYLTQIFRGIGMFTLDKFSENEEDYKPFYNMNLSPKINFLNIMIPDDEKEVKDIITELRDLDKNRNRIVHEFEIDRLLLNGKRVKLSLENIKKINNNIKNLIERLHKLLFTVLTLDILTEEK